jgi:hypothetical protein
LQRSKLNCGNSKYTRSKLSWSRKEEWLNETRSEIADMAQALGLNPKITLNQSGYNFTRVGYISTRSILVNCGSVPLTLPETVIHRRPQCCTENRFHFSLSSIRVICGSQPFISLSSIFDPSTVTIPSWIRCIWVIRRSIRVRCGPEPLILHLIFDLSTSTMLFWK